MNFKQFVSPLVLKRNTTRAGIRKGEQFTRLRSLQTLPAWREVSRASVPFSLAPWPGLEANA